ncbi:histidine kinase-like protein [Actinomadura pelletieri DSM 43383]|uniref:Histidine kinase-like protein n=1 Tax=Actinomadura pelletieri DSM 43383 TaxID=1120940 RepID=A0A495Q9Y3_9ACTN|nr:ATP-binding protein [Actinomadura pelletieri]RKS68299.1 histidine kinase-like protein [Actinomadura pelletieri DSM 43383]
MIDAGRRVVVNELVVDSNFHAPRHSRDFLAKCFSDRGIEDDYVGRTVVNELVTNAYEHTRTGQIVVWIFEEEYDGSVVVAVWDQGPNMPVIQEAEETAESGRGLLMMALLVREWGVQPISKGGKIVWAKLDR